MEEERRKPSRRKKALFSILVLLSIAIATFAITPPTEPVSKFLARFPTKLEKSRASSNLMGEFVIEQYAVYEDFGVVREQAGAFFARELEWATMGMGFRSMLASPTDEHSFVILEYGSPADHPTPFTTVTCHRRAD